MRPVACSPCNLPSFLEHVLKKEDTGAARYGYLFVFTAFESCHGTSDTLRHRAKEQSNPTVTVPQRLAGVNPPRWTSRPPSRLPDGLSPCKKFIWVQMEMLRIWENSLRV